jgi:hypothetical protein
VLNRLIELHYEENLLKLIRESAQERRLDASVEYAYTHCQEVLRRTGRDRAATAAGKRVTRSAQAKTASAHRARQGDGGSGTVRRTRGERPAVRHEELAEDVRALCRAFVQDVNALRQA